LNVWQAMRKGTIKDYSKWIDSSILCMLVQVSWKDIDQVELHIMYDHFYALK
jgi:hypothetical protein